MLNEEVVREVDALAHRLGTSRSNLINQILAEYVNYTTPERRINDIFSALEQLISPSRELVPFFSPNSSTMSLKSSLQYKYRPTVKYELELHGGDENSIGELTVLFRTQSGSAYPRDDGVFPALEAYRRYAPCPPERSGSMRCTTASSSVPSHRPPRTAPPTSWRRPSANTSSFLTG